MVNIININMYQIVLGYKTTEIQTICSHKHTEHHHSYSGLLFYPDNIKKILSSGENWIKPAFIGEN